MHGCPAVLERPSQSRRWTGGRRRPCRLRSARSARRPARRGRPVQGAGRRLRHLRRARSDPAGGAPAGRLHRGSARGRRRGGHRASIDNGAGRHRTSTSTCARPCTRINPGAFWRPTLNGEPAPHPLLLDNPFTVVPYRNRATVAGSWPRPSTHTRSPLGAASWMCRPTTARVAAAVADLGCPRARGGGQRGRAAHLPWCATPANGWTTNKGRSSPPNRPSVWSASATHRPATSDTRRGPSTTTRVLSFTHAVAGPTVGRTLAEQGADVLGVTRPNDYEHEFIYAEANVGSRSAYVDLDRPEGRDSSRETPGRRRRGGQQLPAAIRSNAAVWTRTSWPIVTPGSWSSRSRCYGRSGPWAGRGGFDMNGSASARVS